MKVTVGIQGLEDIRGVMPKGWSSNEQVDTDWTAEEFKKYFKEKHYIVHSEHLRLRGKDRVRVYDRKFHGETVYFIFPHNNPNGKVVQIYNRDYVSTCDFWSTKCKAKYVKKILYSLD